MSKWHAYSDYLNEDNNRLTIHIYELPENEDIGGIFPGNIYNTKEEAVVSQLIDLLSWSENRGIE